MLYKIYCRDNIEQIYLFTNIKYYIFLQLDILIKFQKKFGIFLSHPNFDREETKFGEGQDHGTKILSPAF